MTGEHELKLWEKIFRQPLGVHHAPETGRTGDCFVSASTLFLPNLKNTFRIVLHNLAQCFVWGGEKVMTTALKENIL